MPGLWSTMGYRLDAWEVGTSTVSWEATQDYGFATSNGYVVQGGLVTAQLDSAMGGACWTVLDDTQIFLTADLRVEFLRSTPMGHLVAVGTVVRATSRVVFCAGELHLDSPDGALLASARCTQVVLPADHRGRRATG
ncbi:PaaI family thioesterase [uncultured Jatrophihabitans sp.]|uniref:PaaI family thioesterase n=1 Tax=uncultured Jatrophihabitans sp. TaxID=1610747 RepID=UPI0035CAFD08